MPRNLKVAEEEGGGASGSSRQAGEMLSHKDTNRAHRAAPRRKDKDLPENLAQGRFTMEKKLGEGSFGMVFAAHDVKTKQKVAIKLEHKKSAASGQLGNEARLMDMLSRPVRPPGFAEIFFFGKEGNYAILVMDLLGLSIEGSVEACNGKMNAGSAANIAEQALHLLAYVHSKSIIHRDIKTENFMWGLGPKVHHLYVIDFGMSARYWIKKHSALTAGKQMTGTARYASINAMKGYTQSRRDDLEALGHLLMYLLRGALPWSGLDAPTANEKLKLICETKEKLPLADLCKGYPREFHDFLDYSRKLPFEAKPEYDRFVTMFRNSRQAQNPPVQDHHLQWINESKLDVASLVPLQIDGKTALQPEELGPGMKSTFSGASASATPHGSEAE